MRLPANLLLRHHSLPFSASIRRPILFPPFPLPRRFLSTNSLREPLNILFAGSDHFSAVSLRALAREHKTNPSFISSLQVLCRAPGKTGRKRDILTPVPIDSIASTELSLPIHHITSFDTFTLPSTPTPTLLIAVSFGLKIPADLINSLPYGGLNVHPSLLPQYRGAAPIHHTILDHAPKGGVTIQTLHPTKFDHGEILMQTEPPMDIPYGVRYPSLLEDLAQEGAKLLVETLRRGLYIPPVRSLPAKYPVSLARKVTSEDKRINWTTWTAAELEQRAEMFGDVWTMLGRDSVLGGEEKQVGLKRALLDGMERVTIPEADLEAQELKGIRVGCFRQWRWWDEVKEKMMTEMVIRAVDGWVKVGGVKVEGKGRVDGPTWITGLQPGRGVGRRFL